MLLLSSALSFILKMLNGFLRLSLLCLYVWCAGVAVESRLLSALLCSWLRATTTRNIQYINAMVSFRFILFLFLFRVIISCALVSETMRRVPYTIHSTRTCTHTHTHTNKTHRRINGHIQAFAHIHWYWVALQHIHMLMLIHMCDTAFLPVFFSCLFLFYSLIKSVCSVFNAAAVTAAGSLCACICMSSFFPLLDRCTHYSVWPTYTSPKSRKSRIYIERKKK